MVRARGKMPKAGKNGNGRKSERLSHRPDTESKTPVAGGIMVQMMGASKVAGEVRKLLGVFNPALVGLRTRLLMRNDPDVAFGLAILRAPIINLRWSITSEDDKIAAFVEDQIRPIYRQAATGLSLAIGNGQQACEKVWETRDITVLPKKGMAEVSSPLRFPNAWTYHRFKAIDPRTYSLLIDQEADEWGGIEQNTTRLGLPPRGEGNTARVGPEQAALWSFRREEAWGRLDGYPLLDQVYEPWWWKTALSMFANRYYERRADPVLRGRGQAEIQDSDGNAIDGFEFLAQQMLELKNGSAFMLPSTRDASGNLLFDVDFLADDKRGDMFQARLQYLGTQIMRGLWITDEAATSQGSGGRTRSEVHFETMAFSLETILTEFIEDVVQPQIVDPLVLYNFGERAMRESRTRIRGAGLSEDMRALLKDLVTNLLQVETITAAGGTMSLADRIDAQKIADQLGVPLKSDEELAQQQAEREARRPDTGPGDLSEEDIARMEEEMEEQGVLERERTGSSGEDDDE